MNSGMIGDAGWKLSGHNIGHFDVTTDAETVQRFSNAITFYLDPADRDKAKVPFTFPIVWLGQDRIKKSVLAALGEDPDVQTHALVQLEQSFYYFCPLLIEHPYQLDVRLIGPDQNRQCQLETVVSVEGGKSIATMSVGFLLVDLEASLK